VDRRVSLRAIFLFALAALLGACAAPPPASTPPPEREAIAARLMQDIGMLASDEFGGRAPGTPGGTRTVEYLAQRFAEIGLSSGTNDPGNPWRAPVNLTAISAGGSKVEITLGGRTTTLRRDEAIAVTTRRRELIADAPLVFVGRAAERVTSEQVMGKVAVMLADDSLNPERRILIEDKQAAAVIVITDRDDIVAGIARDSSRRKIALAGDVEVVFAAIATHSGMARALGQARWDALVAAAAREDFVPVELAATVDIEATAERRDFTSHNVLGRLPGTDPESGAVLLVGHWDHLGECAPPSAPDRICNGAIDNASGVALMLELARRLAAGGSYTRDIYVLATSAEEAGLLGAKAFVANPPVPLDRFVAAFNFDTVALAPAGAPVGFIGEGSTPLDPLVLETLAARGRTLGNRDYAKRFVRRLDSWVLLQKGVPAVMLSSAFGSEITAGPYFENRYHSPADEVAGIELGGAIDDLLLHEDLVRRLAEPSVAG
jgi:hypothetical protein